MFKRFWLKILGFFQPGAKIAEPQYVVDLPVRFLPDVMCRGSLVWCNWDRAEPKHTLRTIYRESDIDPAALAAMQKYHPVRHDRTKREDAYDYRPIHEIVAAREKRDGE